MTALVNSLSSEDWEKESEWGLPENHWPPCSPQSQDTNPSMSKGRPGEETREENTERNPSLASHSASTLLSCLSVDHSCESGTGVSEWPGWTSSPSLHLSINPPF
ncbi:hypothetical protein E3U43_013976 [Larimichthys crocea]|uniref:Uncharacterized protein n=1 Tax=Larimichthys crocea TaxID=215358 RepID=A0ACD3RBG0_LARCR|nr:hypothetical protein E3U43_013976 [Larimichthys crocea]